jgi:hypothetical protein
MPIRAQVRAEVCVIQGEDCPALYLEIEGGAKVFIEGASE